MARAWSGARADGNAHRGRPRTTLFHAATRHPARHDLRHRAVRDARLHADRPLSRRRADRHPVLRALTLMTLPPLRRARVAALLVTLAAAAQAQESTKEPPRIE